MRLLVTGIEGQVARSLVERGAQCGGVEIVAVGRPALDLTRPEEVGKLLSAHRPDVVVNAAAYTAVDQAESEPEAAFAVNAEGAGAVAAVARDLGAPLIHLSTDYVFDGLSPNPYRETDAIGPANVYGCSKAAGEARVQEACPDAVILRLAWVYSPFGRNFVRTMLRLAQDRQVVRVVADQHGAPTSALDIAEAVIRVAQRLVSDPDPQLRGIFHMAAGGRANWAQFAEVVFEESAKLNGPLARVEPIATSQYPTAAARPANSQLDCSKLQSIYKISLPHWRGSVAPVIERLLAETRSGAGART